MGKYICRKLLQVIPVLIIISIIVFLLVHASGDPTSMLLPPEAGPEAREAMRAALGLDKPLYVQYAIFIRDAVHGDFGTSFRYNVPATTVVLEKLPYSLKLAVITIIVSLIIGVVMGILCALFKDSPFDLVLSVISSLGRSMPSFWVGIMLILLLAVKNNFFPVSGVGTWKHMVLPVTTLSILTSAEIIPLVRSSMLDVLQQDFIRTAKSKGIKNSKLTMVHAFKNALPPIITIVSLQVPSLIGGSLVTETVFALPGLGQLMIQSINLHDMSVVQASVMIVACVTIIANIIADILYCVVDPRIRM